jgi:type II secretory pathway pseudopilin PulG
MYLSKSRSMPVAPRESGYILLTVVFLTFLFVLALAVAAPRMAVELQRDKEQETIHRGLQYVRAIRMYYKTFGKYPSTLDDLDQGGRYRFLRKRYADPLTGKNDWRLIHLGEATVPVLGFFGQPIPVPPPQGSPASSASTGSDNTGIDPSANNAPAGGPQTASVPGVTNDPENPAGNTGGTASTNSPNNGPVTDGNGIFGPNGSIVGVALPMEKPSLLAWRKQQKYNRWEFVYDPLADQVGATSIFGGDPPPNPGDSSSMDGVSLQSGGGSTSDSPVSIRQTSDTPQ